MPAAKKKKVSATTSYSERTITTFAKVSKSQVVSKSVQAKVSALDDAAASQLVQNVGLGKRKRNSEDTWERATVDLINQATTPLPEQSIDSKRSLRTPRRLSAKETLTTPTKGTQALFDKLLLSTPTATKISPPPLPSAASNTTAKPYSPPSQKVDFPTELLDLVHLHSSFLTALSLRYAHNGIWAPVDLHVLCPDVARIWGKRKVVPEDIRRILGILNSTAIVENNSSKQASAELRLSDYGHKRICIEIRIDSEAEGTANPLNEDFLNDMFIWKLRKLWERNEGIKVSPTDFIGNLPLEHVTVCSSLIKISPLLAKGQQRLADFKAATAKKKSDKKDAAEELTVVDKSGRKPTLLERLKAKELRQSTLPAPPSKAELAQLAAMHRVKEVVKALSLFSTSSSVGQRRVSFTMQTVLGKLRDSLRTPISMEEGETCVRLLASTLAPEWLNVVKIGKTDAIVVNRDNCPSDLDIEKRVNLGT